MYKKISVLMVLCLLLGAMLCGCAQPEPTQGSQPSGNSANPTGSNVLPRTVMIEGKLYYDYSASRTGIVIEEGDVLGHITSIVSITTVPTQDNEANYSNAEGAPYARWTDEEYGETYVIYYREAWHPLCPAK